jgi:nucleoside-triphosphatase THEP1
MMAVRIVTADRGAGKTTFLIGYMSRVADSGKSVGGIASPAVIEDGRRIGYDLLDLRRRKRRLLARLGKLGKTRTTIGPYWFDDDALAEGNAAVISAVHDGLDVISIDEIGPLEFEEKGWARALAVALQELRCEQELMVVVRPSLVERLSTRFPSALWATAKRVSPPWPSRF